jgi:hypothetical protein
MLTRRTPSDFRHEQPDRVAMTCGKSNGQWAWGLED